jgi:hypothetical protein
VVVAVLVELALAVLAVAALVVIEQNLGLRLLRVLQLQLLLERAVPLEAISMVMLVLILYLA